MWQQAKLLTLVALLASTPAAWGQNSAWRSKQDVAALARKIDEHIAAAQKGAGVVAAPPAEHGAFFRRLHIDLVGRIPEYTDSRGYIEDDDPEKLWDRSGRFLEDKTFSRHFAAVLRSHILNSANQQAQPLLPPFELWLRERLQAGKGYDQIVREILAPGAEMVGNGMAQFRGGQGQGGPSAAAFYLAGENKAENLAGSASRVFLGVKLECAQCHAHPFAKWTKDEFWQFAAFFVGTQPSFGRFNPDGTQPVAVPASTVREITIPGSGKVVKARFLAGDEPKWKDNEATRKVLADWIASPKNPYFAKATADVVWQYFFGVSLLEPIMEPSDDRPITHPQLLNDLAQSLIAHEFDLKFLIRAIVHTQAYQRSSGNHGPVTKDDYVLFTRMPVRGMSPEQLYDSVIEAVVGPKGHGDASYQPNFEFGGPRGANNSRAEFLGKFVNQDKRHESQTTILQALFLMNNKFLGDKIKNNDNLDTISREPSDDKKDQLRNRFVRTHTREPRSEEMNRLITEDRIRTLFLLLLTREPRPEESNRLAGFLEEGGPNQRPRLGDIMWALVNSAEFRLNH